MLISLLAACSPGGAAETPVGTPHGTLHPQVVELEGRLTAEFGMRFTDAGPHHRLGKVDGVEVDLIGSPLEGAVLSVPLNAAMDRAVVLEAYTIPIAEAMGADEQLTAWASGTFRAWQREEPLEAEASIGELEVRMYSSTDPDYVVLVVARPGSG